ncbi:hypothetical protein PITCH_A1280001 [uncultured Desulfobacterium sp.]|uniref:Uncharacterized protein n=1 Tax=uncultured Desulfobacterium sp. TaxID=201089 RepID=A0A445MS33_9BACT|nr:hypothetical protein PITCH_A1280001 [uncultured Desulfobacterium sp.]
MRFREAAEAVDSILVETTEVVELYRAWCVETSSNDDYPLSEYVGAPDKLKTT